MAGVTTYGTGSTTDKTTDYLGNKIYEDGVLKKILVDGGYFDVEEDKYYFYSKDHLGNNRAVVEAETNTVTQQTHYYPFGMSFADKLDNSKQSYLYNDKELDTSMGLNTYDYAARYMTPDAPRFTTVDPHAERYYNISPYVYAANNPIKIIDPLGTDTVHVNPDGTPQRFPDGGIISHPGEGDDVLIQDQPLAEVTILGNKIIKPNTNGTVAIGYIMYSVDVEAGMSVEKSYSVICILEGPDAGYAYTYETEMFGMGGLGMSLTNSITLYSYYGDVNNFTKDSFVGESKVTNTSADVGVSVIFGESNSYNKLTNERLHGRSFGYGFGLGIPINGYAGTAKTKLHNGKAMPL